jgi:hypothetical protein
MRWPLYGTHAPSWGKDARAKVRSCGPGYWRCGALRECRRGITDSASDRVAPAGSSMVRAHWGRADEGWASQSKNLCDSRQGRPCPGSATAAGLRSTWQSGNPECPQAQLVSVRLAVLWARGRFSLRRCLLAPSPEDAFPPTEGGQRSLLSRSSLRSCAACSGAGLRSLARGRFSFAVLPSRSVAGGCLPAHRGWVAISLVAIFSSRLLRPYPAKNRAIWSTT